MIAFYLYDGGMTDESSNDLLPPAPFSVTIKEEMERSYLDYAMSVIVSRALPDLRDGLKPVQRRILFRMKESGNTPDKNYRKSARIVGEVMGRYHPHGDAAIYDAMVRMAQDFSMRLPLVDGQGNFGSQDGDPPAAMRYTEARLHGDAMPLLQDIDYDTVEFRDNYDSSAQEPEVLPARFPNLLINGAGGIAVGMATNIPPHNPSEILDGLLQLVDNPDTTEKEMMTIITAPDFPTGGMILGLDGIRSLFKTGKGSLRMRARAEIMPLKRQQHAIVVHDIPYQVNKSRLIERIAHVARDKQVEGISDIRDESNREGMRIVIETRASVEAQVVLNQLYRLTPLESSFSAHMLMLVDGKPQSLPMLAILRHFLAFREATIGKRTLYHLKKSREKASNLLGIAVVVSHLDTLLKMIRQAKDSDAARAALTAHAWNLGDVAPYVALVEQASGEKKVSAGDVYHLSDDQARAILQLRLHRLTSLEREKIFEELRQLTDAIAEYSAILSDRTRLLAVLKEELQQLREQLASPRRTEVVADHQDTADEDLIQSEDMVVTLSQEGYIKSTPRTSYRPQKRGGQGSRAMTTHEQDFVLKVYDVNSHTKIFFFSSWGKIYGTKVHKLPKSKSTARGRHFAQLFPIKKGEMMHTMMPCPDEWQSDDYYVILATASGSIRRNQLTDFSNVAANGKRAMHLSQNDHLIGASVAQEGDHILLSTRQGKSVRFAVEDLRVFSKGSTSHGVRAMTLEEGDEIVSQAIVEKGVGEAHCLLTVRSDGYGKRTPMEEYRITSRGGKGIVTMKMAEQTQVVAAVPVTENDEVIITSNRGQLIRCAASGISFSGRASRGVRLFRCKSDEFVTSVAIVKSEEVAS